MQARTHVQLALACQRSMPCAQHKLRLTMQHVYGPTGNLGNEWADHAAALKTLDLVSNHNLATRWLVITLIPLPVLVLATLVRYWKHYVTMELKQRRYLSMEVSAVFFIGLAVTFTHALHHCGFALSSLSRAQPFYCTSLYLK